MGRDSAGVPVMRIALRAAFTSGATACINTVGILNWKNSQHAGAKPALEAALPSGALPAKPHVREKKFVSGMIDYLGALRCGRLQGVALVGDDKAKVRRHIVR